MKRWNPQLHSLRQKQLLKTHHLNRNWTVNPKPFRYLWLWLGLGLVLAVVLPLYYSVTEYKSLHGDDDDGDESGGDTATASS